MGHCTITGLQRGCQTYGIRAQNGMREDFLCSRRSLLSHFFKISFAQQSFLYCEECVCMHAYIHIYIYTHRGLVEALHHKSEGRGFDSR